MPYLIFAVVMAAVLITVLALRDRLSRSPGRSVDAFRRAITALMPEEEAEGTPPTSGTGSGTGSGTVGGGADGELGKRRL